MTILNETRLVELAFDPEKITRNLKFAPDIHNIIKNYQKIPTHRAFGKRLKFIMAVLAKISQF